MPQFQQILVKSILFCGKTAILACDGNCRKAWGMNNRERFQFSQNEDDYEYLADDELGEAPDDPGTYEGPDAKPTDLGDIARQNKWCARECERSEIADSPGLMIVPDFSKRLPNLFSRRDN